MEKARSNTELYYNPKTSRNNVKTSNFWGSHHIYGILFYNILTHRHLRDPILKLSGTFPRVRPPISACCRHSTSVCPEISPFYGQNVIFISFVREMRFFSDKFHFYQSCCKIMGLCVLPYDGGTEEGWETVLNDGVERCRMNGNAAVMWSENR